MKRKFLHNIVKFIVGFWLLTLCLTYLQSHPAEKISFFSGFKIIFQNAEIFFQNLFGNNGDLLKQKYSLESYYEALISLSEEKPCIEASLIEDLHTTYEKLLTEPKNTLNYTLNDYIHKQIEFDKSLRIDCTPPSE